MMDSYNRILTGKPRLFCRHIQSNLFKAEFALPMHVLISLSQLPVLVTTLPKYEGRSKSFEPYPFKRKVDK